MNVEQELRNGLDKILSGRLTNEAQIKQAVILPILRGLGWDDSDPNEFVPELSVDLDDGKGLVDYALFRTSPIHQPLVFIEAKNLDKADTTGEEQVFRYASNKGVPFLILTDGNIWNFYLAMAEGVPADRRVYRAELRQEEKLGEYAEKFESYLEKRRVLSGEAKKEAEEQNQSDKNRTVARNAIEGCWRSLVNEPEQALIDLLVEAVERESGIRPEMDDVETFLKEQFSYTASIPVSSAFPPMTPRVPLSSETPSKPGKLVGFVLDGVRTQPGAANLTLAGILKEFQRRDQTFMVRLYEKGIGRTRRLVARNRDDLYDTPHMREFSLDLENGWWLGTHLSRATAIKHIELACEVAGVSYGTRLTLIHR